MSIHESAENYLETILVLTKQLGAVRSVDIANHLEFSRPSVSVAMKKLRAGGHIAIDSHGCITLTERGQNVANAMYERHTILTRFLGLLGVDEQTAKEDACRVEHIISQQTFEKISEYVTTNT